MSDARVFDQFADACMRVDGASSMRFCRICADAQTGSGQMHLLAAC
ncbi:hypothetical protein K6979_00850 [Xanthomonas cucurbitae]|nr:hypothetical protein [Xanthomonas cucurbitae]WDM83031.1 hypothetical protein K6979_00850 [Xanthomonas cucurbitae]